MPSIAPADRLDSLFDKVRDLTVPYATGEAGIYLPPESGGEAITLAPDGVPIAYGGETHGLYASDEELRPYVPDALARLYLGAGQIVTAQFNRAYYDAALPTALEFYPDFVMMVVCHSPLGTRRHSTYMLSRYPDGRLTPGTITSFNDTRRRAAELPHIEARPTEALHEVIDALQAHWPEIIAARAAAQEREKGQQA